MSGRKKEKILQQSHLKDLYDELDQKETQDILTNPDVINKYKIQVIEKEDFKGKSSGDTNYTKKHSFEISNLFGKKPDKIMRLRTQSDNVPSKEEVDISKNYQETVLKEYSMCSNQKNL